MDRYLIKIQHFVDRFRIREVFEKAAGMVSTISKFKASNFLTIGAKDVTQLSMAGDHLVGILLQIC